ncbi:MAG: hypothetical protein E7173_00500 [Firmicutes bacterium]|nr:hypothetical protein [Bacillota bacterium]
MIGILILSILAFILSLILVTLEYKLNKKDIRQEKYCELLPGYNCGACGFGSCEGMAKAMLEDIDNYKKCKPLRGEPLEKLKVYIEKIN